MSKIISISTQTAKASVHIVVVLLQSLVVLTVVFCIAKLALAADTSPCFYVPFDGSVEPAVADGSSVLPGVANFRFAEGRFGEGLLVSEDGSAPSVLYRADANIKPESGTLCFWFKPAWSNDEDVKDEYRNFLSVGHSGGSAFQFYWQKSKRALFFATGGKDPTDGVWKWNYAPGKYSPFLKKGQWVHLAIVWDGDSKRKAIYVNGAMLTQARGGLGVLCAAGNFQQLLLRIGATYQNHRIAPGIYDELIIYPKALDDEAIRRLWQRNEPLPVPKTISQPEPPLRIEIGIPEPPEGLIFPGETFYCQVPIRNLDDKEFQGDLHYTCLDYYHREVARVTHRIVLAVSEARKDTVQFAPGYFGPFKVRVQYRAPERGGSSKTAREWGRDVVTFGVVPRELSRRGPKPDSFFGHHPHTFGTTLNLNVCKRIGVKWIRNLDMTQSTWWLYVEPEPGKFEFKLEEDINLAIFRGINVLGTFFWTPLWAADVPADWPKDNIFYRCYPPKDWEAFRRYVRMTVRHYKDRIKYWEAWNEPHHGGCWRGTPEQYVKLLQIVYETCKEEDPDCKVLGMGGTCLSVKDWNEKVLAAGALKFMDIFDVHPAFSISLQPEQAQAQVEKFYALMDKYGERKPIWHTESGLTSTTFYSDLDFPELPPPENRNPPPNFREAANALVRTYCSWMSRGVQKHFFYYMRAMKGSPARTYVDYGMADVTGTPKPDGFAYAAMAWLLEDAKWETEWQRTQHDSYFVSFNWRTSKVGDVRIPPDLLLRGHLFEGKARAIAVVWTEPGVRVRLNLPPASWEFRNIMGNRIEQPVIREEPCYLILHNASAVTLSKLLQQATLTVKRGKNHF